MRVGMCGIEALPAPLALTPLQGLAAQPLEAQGTQYMEAERGREEASTPTVSRLHRGAFPASDTWAPPLPPCRCWRHNPEERPSAAEVAKRLTLMLAEQG